MATASDESGHPTLDPGAEGTLGAAPFRLASEPTPMAEEGGAGSMGFLGGAQALLDAAAAGGMHPSALGQGDAAAAEPGAPPTGFGGVEEIDGWLSAMATQLQAADPSHAARIRLDCLSRALLLGVDLTLDRYQRLVVQQLSAEQQTQVTNLGPTFALEKAGGKVFWAWSLARVGRVACIVLVRAGSCVHVLLLIVEPLLVATLL